MFRFSTRDVLWLTALVAVLLAWYLDRNLLSLRLADLQQAIIWGVP